MADEKYSGGKDKKYSDNQNIITNVDTTIKSGTKIVKTNIDHVVADVGQRIGASIRSNAGSSAAFSGNLLNPLPNDLGVNRPPKINIEFDPTPEKAFYIVKENVKSKIKYWKRTFLNAIDDIDVEILNLDQAAFEAIGAVEDLIKAPVKTIKESIKIIADFKIPLLPCVEALDKQLHVLSSLLSILRVVLGLLKKIVGVLKLIFKFPSPLFIVKWILNICGEIANAIADQFDKSESESTGSDPATSMSSEAATAAYSGQAQTLPPAVPGTGMYYGTGPNGAVGFFNMPTADEDIMRKSEYDPNRNGLVTEAEWASDSRISTSNFGSKLGPSHSTVQKAIDALSRP